MCVISHPSTPSHTHTTALMWGYGLLLTMFVVTREELYGEYAAPDVAMFLMAYGSYAAVPILVMLRVASYPVFNSKQKSS